MPRISPRFFSRQFHSLADDASTCIVIPRVASTLGEDRGSTPRRNMHEALEGVCVDRLISHQPARHSTTVLADWRRPHYSHFPGAGRQGRPLIDPSPLIPDQAEQSRLAHLGLRSRVQRRGSGPRWRQVIHVCTTSSPVGDPLAVFFCSLHLRRGWAGSLSLCPFCLAPTLTLCYAP